MSRTRAKRTKGPSAAEKKRREAQAAAKKNGGGPKVLDAKALVARREDLVTEFRNLKSTREALAEQLADVEKAIEQARGKVTIVVEQLRELGVTNPEVAQVDEDEAGESD